MWIYLNLYQIDFHFQAFEDRVLQGRILYLLGQLSLEEAQYKQAFNLAVEAQVCRLANIKYEVISSVYQNCLMSYSFLKYDHASLWYRVLMMEMKCSGTRLAC